MLRFSKANAKTERLAKTPLKKWLKDGKKIYSLDLLSGFSCPNADKCLAKAIRQNDKMTRWDGPNQEYTCFSASQEIIYKNLYNLRKHNFDTLRKIKNCVSMAERILADIPANCGILRLSVAGDIFNYEYFKALTIVAKQKPSILIYGYTKSLPFWTRYLDEFGELPQNLVLTASIGSNKDDLIEKYNLRTAKVVYSQYEARKLKLRIDTTDIMAADPNRRNKNFALLIHGNGKANSKHSKAWQRVQKTVGGYKRVS